MMKSVVVAILLASSCGPPPEPEEPVVVNNPEWQPSPEEAKDDVERVCAKLRHLQCEEGFPTKEGNTCEYVIRNAETQGIDLLGDVECTMVATSCEQARACE